MRREQVTSTFSLLRNGGAAGDATAEAGSASARGTLKPKRVRSGRAGAESSDFSAAAASAEVSVRFRFFAMGVYYAASKAAKS
jgi:hypothetical protein